MEKSNYMLVNLRIAAWSARKMDRSVSADIAAKHNSSPDAGKYNKLLVPKDSLDPISATIALLRRTHNMMTLPWSDNGERILPNAAMLDYKAQMDPLKLQFNTQADTFAQSYTKLMGDRKTQLNGLYNENDYPQDWKIRGKFSCDTEFRAMPESPDFRTGQATDETEKVKKELQQQYSSLSEQRVTDATKDLWTRLMQPLEVLIEALREDGKPIKEATRNNLITIAKMIPDYNISGDQALDEAAQQLHTMIAGTSTEDLRTNKTTREQFYNGAISIMKKKN